VFGVCQWVGRGVGRKQGVKSRMRLFTPGGVEASLARPQVYKGLLNTHPDEPLDFPE